MTLFKNLVSKWNQLCSATSGSCDSNIGKQLVVLEVNSANNHRAETTKCRTSAFPVVHYTCIYIYITSSIFGWTFYGWFSPDSFPSSSPCSSHATNPGPPWASEPHEAAARREWKSCYTALPRQRATSTWFAVFCRLRQQLLPAQNPTYEYPLVMTNIAIEHVHLWLIVSIENGDFP